MTDTTIKTTPTANGRSVLTQAFVTLDGYR
jgi:hypothetical protein